MRSGPRPALFVAVALVASAVFVTLGFWQLDRLDQRRAENERKRRRLARPPVELAAGGSGAGTALPPAGELDWRRVVVRGRFDYAAEIVLGPRSFHGTPGVYLLTPLVVGDSTAVLVLRGGMPAPDGFHAPLEEARPAQVDGGGALPEAPEVTVRGVALAFPGHDGSPPVDTLRAGGGAHPVLKTLDLERVREVSARRIPGFYVRSDSTTERIAASGGPAVPTPVALPALDDGPHLMYAIQWFAFAAIVLVGGAIFLWIGGDGGEVADDGDERDGVAPRR